MAGGGNGQPLGDTLHNAKENGFQNFDHGVTPYKKNTLA